MGKALANKEKTKPKKPAPAHAWKPGQSGNPAGRPKDGESWAGVFKDLANRTPEELAEMFGSNDLGNAYKKLPKGVQMKYLVGGRILAALMFEPSGSLLNIYMERMEGKVPDRLKIEELPLLVFGKKEDADKPPDA